METRISIIIQRENLERMNTFKYLGATLAENGDLDTEMTHRIQSGWKTGRGYRGFCAIEEYVLESRGKYARQL